MIYRYALLTIAILIGWSANFAQAASKPTVHWLFQPEYVDHLTLNDTTGSHTGKINGLVQFWNGHDLAAMTFDGLHNRVLSSPVANSLSTTGLSVAAWVSIDRPLPQGGIVGIFPSKGTDPAGWTLGFQEKSFTFSLSTDSKNPPSILTSQTAFQPGSWYHVVGIFDGKTQKLFINGKLEASAATQGKINFPSEAEYILGAARSGKDFQHLQGMIHEITISGEAMSADEIRALFDSKATSFPPPLEITVGPHVEFVSRTAATVRWETSQPTSSLIAYGIDKQLTQQVKDSGATRVHQLTIDPIRPNSIYSFQIRGTANNASFAGKTHTFDSHFNYTLPTITESKSPYPVDELTALYESTAERILQQSGITAGYCLVLGVEQGRLAYELAKRSRLKIVAVDPNQANVSATRAALGDTEYYGQRISVRHGEVADLPYGEYMANLIVSDTLLIHGKLEADPAEVYRVLRPSGGVAYLGQAGKKSLTVSRESLKRWLSEDPNDESKIDDVDGLFAVVRRGELAGAGEWTHQYGHADNSSCSRDFLVRGQMNVLWWGRPGPRPMPDRGPRNPAPLSAGGRLYVQGDRVLFGLDAYNGTVLWSKQTPVVRRANMPRDCSNMVAAHDAVYVAERDHVLTIDGQTGAVSRIITIPERLDGADLDWGYLGCVGDTLLGSTVKQGAAYLGDFGEWYNDNVPQAIAKVTSESLFALDREDGSQRWDYRGGVIVNSTLTVSDENVYFVESRNPQALNSSSGRLIEEIHSQQFLVALDLKTGEKKWEQKTDLKDALRIMYLVHADNTLTVTGASEDNYHIWAFNTEDGKPLWQDTFPIHRKDHGKAMQHPVAVGGTLYCELRGYNIRTGKVERTDVPERRGCGTMAASNYAFFFRDHFHGMWDLETNTRTEFQGIRGGCWLGQIPAGGLMLAPETSAGCSCTHSIQISVGYIPAAMTKQRATKE